MIASGEREGQIGKVAVGARRVWVILGLFATGVALTGGASRFDAIQIVPLRTLSALFLASSLLYLTREKLRAERTLITLFGCYALIVLMQLVPLPPSLWQSLPQRVEVQRLDVALGLDGNWRPLTLTPMRTWNVLGSLIVPGAALMLAITSRAPSIVLLRIVAGLGVLNAFLGLLQIAGGDSSAFYFYEITNRGSPVGILASENHAAIFSACCMLVVALLGLRAIQKESYYWEKFLYLAAFFFILFVSLVGGSRAGFAAVIGASLASIAMLALSSTRQHGRPNRGTVRRWFDRRPFLVFAMPIAIISLTAASFLTFDRAPAFHDILARDNFADLRWSLWPVVAEMLEDHWLLGAGFGSFEQVYHIYEPSTLLMPSYVNQAHNDWAQIVIEGGVLSGLLLFWLIVWVARGIGAISSHRALKVEGIFWVSVFAIVAAASLVDYPLRTPLFQLVTVWLLIALSQEARDKKTT